MTRRPERFTDYRWPKKGDRLLRESTDWNRGVEFPQGDSCTRHGYIWNGYMSAAKALIEICEDDLPQQQILVYPILFSYRHAMELAMKWIIVMYGHDASADVGTIEHHDLWQLWKVCRGIITEADGDDEAIPVVEQVIKDFHDLDKTALAFRYSRKKNGGLIALPEGLIDLQNICDVMEGVGHFFDGADEQLSDYASVAP